jgi:hypothetical protein
MIDDNRILLSSSQLNSVIVESILLSSVISDDSSRVMKISCGSESENCSLWLFVFDYH